MKSAYLLYSPVQKLGADFKIGGATCIKTNSTSSYLGFATEQLAREFCDRRKMPKDVQIISATELGFKYPVLDATVQNVVVFPNEDALETYLAKPQEFPSESYICRLSSVNMLEP